MMRFFEKQPHPTTRSSRLRNAVRDGKATNQAPVMSSVSNRRVTSTLIFKDNSILKKF